MIIYPADTLHLDGVFVLDNIIYRIGEKQIIFKAELLPHKDNDSRFTFVSLSFTVPIPQYKMFSKELKYIFEKIKQSNPEGIKVKNLIRAVKHSLFLNIVYKLSNLKIKDRGSLEIKNEKVLIDLVLDNLSDKIRFLISEAITKTDLHPTPIIHRVVTKKELI